MGQAGPSAMIVAVTGASGFIGSHLTAELARQGHRVRAIGRSRRDTPAVPLVEQVVLDYGDANALARALADADVVVHGAAATRAPTVDALRAANVEVTRQVLSALRMAPAAPRFVFLSSQAAAGPARSLDSPTAECDAPSPIDAYGRTKLDAERLVDAYDGPWTVVRPASVYGPRDRDFLALFRFASRGIAIHPANRESWISIIHVRDVVAGIIAAATAADAIGKIYFLANDAPVQWSALFQRAAAAAGKHLSFDIEVPRFIVDLGARLGDRHARRTGNASLLTTEKVALSRAPFWVCSNARARRDLGFNPIISLDDGIADTYRWYREHGWIGRAA